MSREHQHFPGTMHSLVWGPKGGARPLCLSTEVLLCTVEKAPCRCASSEGSQSICTEHPFKRGVVGIGNTHITVSIGQGACWMELENQKSHREAWLALKYTQSSLCHCGSVEKISQPGGFIYLEIYIYI